MIIDHGMIEHWQLKPGVLVSVLGNYMLAFIFQLYSQDAGCVTVSYTDNVSQDQFS